MSGIDKLRKELSDKAKVDEPFKSHTSLKIGGPVALFIEASTEEDLKQYITQAKKYKVAFLVVGEGSNLLVHEDGFEGFVIQNKIKGIKVKGTKVLVKLGTNLQEFVDFLAKKGLSGMERMSGIAGNVGGAIFGNAGAYGQTISDHLKRVKGFNGGKVRWIKKVDCGFEYRGSVFKKSGDILLEAEFEFKRGEPKELQRKGADIIKIREEKYKPGLRSPGSYFKNVLVKDLARKSLDKIPEGKIMYEKVPAGYLLEAVGAKGVKKGKIKIAGHHANLFVNLDGGKATDFYQLATEYAKKVEKKFGIKLEPEVQLIGFRRKNAVLGFGIEGRDLVRFLLKKGVDITIFDRKEETELNFGGIDKDKVKLVSGKNYLSKGFLNFDIVFRSAGVYRFIPPLLKAQKAGVEISSAIKLFFDLCPARLIGVTGTKGKGTTASLIYKILKSAGKDVYLAGNIGKPFLELLPKLKKSSWVVLELSSFQLIDIKASPDIGVVLNITVDHLDWHKDRKEYIEAKTHIVRYQKEDDFAVINTGYKVPRDFSKLTNGQVIFFSKNSLDKKFKENLLLKGEHNLENAAAAVLVAKILNVPDKIILDTLSKFKGLEHRLELVGEVGGVSFYNDSFATGPQPTIAAIKSFSQPTTLILGGSEKWLDYKSLGNEISIRKNVKTVVLIGEVAPKIKKVLLSAGFRGEILALGKNKMRTIVRKAFNQTAKGGIVLLSPAAASFDMFKNYKERGSLFKEAVKALKA